MDINGLRIVSGARPNPRALSSKVLALACLLALSVGAAARASAQAGAGGQREAGASVSGRVTDGEKGLAGVTVAIVADNFARMQAAGGPPRAKTGADGRYRIENVPPGNYRLMPLSLTHVVKDFTQFPPGRPLTLSAGDSVEDMDFRLERGGVVTGRVTDAEGNPVVDEHVRIARVDHQPGQMPDFNISMAFNPAGHRTDDAQARELRALGNLDALARHGRPARLHAGQPERRAALAAAAPNP